MLYYQQAKSVIEPVGAINLTVSSNNGNDCDIKRSTQNIRLNSIE
jgi:hypothetical protein